MTTKPGDAYSTPYLDTSVYVAAIKGEQAEPGRGKVSSDVLAEAEASRLRIIASTFVVVECAKDKGGPALDPAEEPLIDGFLQRSFISWVELDVAGARDARRLVREHSIKPPDAVHLAAGLRGKADIFFTWDDVLVAKVGGEVDGMTVCNPYVFQGPQAYDLFTMADEIDAESAEAGDGSPSAPASEVVEEPEAPAADL